MGYWELKPSEQLDIHQCLQIKLEDVKDFITFNTKSGKLTDIDEEHIFDSIREGYVEGEVNDWDIGMEEEKIDM